MRGTRLPSHKVKGGREAIEAKGAEVRYLPRYSPSLNTIEMMWSKVKPVIPKAKACTVELLCQAIGQALWVVTSK